MIGYAGLSSQFPFVADVNAGLEAAAAEAGAELIVLDNEYDPQVALSNADILIQRGANVIIEFQTDVGIAPALCEKFDAAGLGDKVIAIDIPHDPCAAFYGANNPLAGEIAGEALALAAQEKWGEVNKLVLLALPQSGELVVSRTDGYITGVQKVFPDFSEEDVIEVDGQGALEPSLAVMQDVLTTLGGESNILVGAVNDPSAVGALRAISAAGRGRRLPRRGPERHHRGPGRDLQQLAGLHRFRRVLPGELRQRPRRARRRLAQRRVDRTVQLRRARVGRQLEHPRVLPQLLTDRRGSS